MSWPDLTEWWLDEVSNDAAYREVVSPLLFQVLRPAAGGLYLDLGCGEGRVMREFQSLGARAVGIDLSLDLATKAGTAVVAELPEVPMRDHCFDGAYSVLTVEHIEDHEGLFEEVARVVEPGGVLAIVINHPIWTAPGSTPITESDGEVLWRPGHYFEGGFTDEPAGGSKVRFHHRSMSEYLTAAAGAGWSLETMTERPHHDLDDQSGIPRLLACRWRR